jgi:hypothetical protein
MGRRERLCARVARQALLRGRSTSPLDSMFRVAVVCEGITPSRGPQVALDVAAEFTNRPWHRNVRCEWVEGLQFLEAENDFDSTGEAVADEVSDAVAACWSGGYSVRITSVKDASVNAL